jgi:DNA adenine methylase
MVKAPFARQGGKKLLKKIIIPMIPGPDEIDTYVEPFVGAGNIFYNTQPYKKEVINDIDKIPYTIHKGLKSKSKYINDNIERNITRSNFDKVKNKTDAMSLLQKCKMSFFGNCNSLNAARARNKETIQTDFTIYGDRLKNTTILNKDFRKVIKQYDSPKTFFYLDPPYEKSEEQNLYTNLKDFITPQDVFDSLKNIKGKFLLSYNDSPNIRKIFSKYNIKKVKTRYEMKDRGDITELLISNY